MSKRVFNVLFLCTHNSARSILAEAALNGLPANGGRFRAFSAGSHPAGNPHPLALETIERAGLPTGGLHSKSWDEFAVSDAPVIDLVITVCDNAANEACPVWPGRPLKAHWGLPDPSAVPGSDEDRRIAFAQTFERLIRRMNLLTSLPVDKLEHMQLMRKLGEIGQS